MLSLAVPSSLIGLALQQMMARSKRHLMYFLHRFFVMRKQPQRRTERKAATTKQNRILAAASKA